MHLSWRRRALRCSPFIWSKSSCNNRRHTFRLPELESIPVLHFGFSGPSRSVRFILNVYTLRAIPCALDECNKQQFFKFSLLLCSQNDQLISVRLILHLFCSVMATLGSPFFFRCRRSAPISLKKEYRTRVERERRWCWHIAHIHSIISVLQRKHDWLRRIRCVRY